jgi:hypothetical protein
MTGTRNGAHRHRRTTPLLLLLIGAMAALLLPGPVMAGTYQMNQCMAASSRTLSSSWGLFGGIPDAKVFNSCGAGGEFGLTEANSMTYNTVGGLNLTVPDIRPNVTITHVDAEVATAAETASQYSFFRLSGEGQVIFDQEMTGWYHAVGSDLPATRDLQLGIYCSYGNGPQNCSWRSYPVISVGRLSLTLHADGPPTARPTGGTLMSGTPVSGSQTLSYAASDSDSGVRAVSVQLGDTIVGSDDYETACTYATGMRARRSRMETTCRSIPLGCPMARIRLSWSFPTLPGTPRRSIAVAS